MRTNAPLPKKSVMVLKAMLFSVLFVLTGMASKAGVYIYGGGTICAGDSMQLYAVDTNSIGTVHYLWVDTSASPTLTCTTCQAPYARPLVTTTYKVIVTDTLGVDSAFVTVRIGTVSAAVSITASHTTICAGNSVLFTAHPVNGGTAPTYQWYKNGVPVGANVPLYSDNALQNGDTVWVTMISNSTCASTTPVQSNLSIITVNPSPNVTLTVTGAGCSGNALLTLLGASTATQIQWQHAGTTLLTYTPTTSNAILTVAGGNGAGSAPNQLDSVFSVFVDSVGTMYIADFKNNRVQKWVAGATAGVTIAGGNGRGSAANQLDGPSGLVVTPSGDLYVVDRGNQRVQKWAAGATTGTTVAGGNGQGNAANQFNKPIDMAFDASGNLYVADQLNYRVQRFAPGSTTGVTVAGSGTGGTSVGQPVSIYIDRLDNLYVTDQFSHRVLRFSPGSIYGTVVAGGNGGGSAANQLHFPVGVFVDNSFSVYVTDLYNHRVQKWAQGASTGITVAGAANGQAGTGPNQFNAPTDVYLDRNGNIYVCDMNNRRIQEYTVTTTIDTTLVPGMVGDYQAIITTSAGCTVLSNTVTVAMENDTVLQTINQGQTYLGHDTTGVYVDTMYAGLCAHLQTTFLTVFSQNDTTVWPGDADNDGLANNFDLLSLGLAYQDTGSIRPSANNTWTGQYCPVWNNTFLTGVNHNHADCDGNGVVDANDTVPILLNYGLTHPKSANQQNTPSAPLLYLDASALDTLAVNTPYDVPVNLGDANDTAQNVYGIAFSINYDATLIQPNTSNFVALPSWIGTLGSDMISIKHAAGSGVLDVAITRTDHTIRNGIGTIGTFSFVTIDNLSGKVHLVDSLVLSISNIRMINQFGMELPVNNRASVLRLSQDVDGLANLQNLAADVNLYPNPTTGVVNYSIAGLTSQATYQLMDVTGHSIQNGTIQPNGGTTSGQIDLSGLSKGIYLVKIETEQGIVTQKLVLQ